MEQTPPDDQPKSDPAEIARVFGVDQLSEPQAKKWEDALLKRTQEILSLRLYEIVPPEDHYILKKYLAEGDEASVRVLLQRLFRDYDELETAAVVEARNEIISKAAKLQLEEVEERAEGSE